MYRLIICFNELTIIYGTFLRSGIWPTLLILLRLTLLRTSCRSRWGPCLAGRCCSPSGSRRSRDPDQGDPNRDFCIKLFLLERLDEDFVFVVLQVVLELGKVRIALGYLDFLLPPVSLHYSQGFLGPGPSFLELVQFMVLLVDNLL